MKKMFVLVCLGLFLFPFLVSAETFTNQTCTSNSTLRETNQYYFDLNGKPSDDVNLTQIKDTFCEYGCVSTGNVTAECQPKPFDVTLWFIGGIVLLFGAIIFILALSRRR